MNSTEDIVEAKLAAYLDRRTPPRQIINNPQAQDAEMDSILRVLLRFRPSGNLDEWWNRVEDGLSQSCETYSWPLPKHFSKAAQDASKQERKGEASGNTWEPDPLKVNADRMNKGEQVGEFCLYGEKAVQLEQSGRVSPETFKAYRSAAYFKRVHTRRDGTEDRSAADAWEAEQKRQHQQAARRSQVNHTGKAPDVDRIVKTFNAAKETATKRDEVDDRPGYMTADEIAAEDRRAAG